MAEPEENPDLRDEIYPQTIEKETEEEFEFPQDKTLYWIADWSSRLSGIILTVAIINAILKLGNYFTFTLPPAEWKGVGIFNVVIAFLSHLETVLYAGFLYLLLQAVTEIIYLLMDIRDLFQATETEREAGA
jgi:hypothetical protein